LRFLREYRWLWIGLVAAVAVPALGLGTHIAAVLNGFIPLPWGRVGIGILIFAALATFHFRSHWVACLQALGAEKQRAQAAAQLLAEVRMDGSNGVRVIKENLDLVAGGSQRPQEAELYLQGAQAHAAKLEQVFERLEGIRTRLGTPTHD
jgi:hypothetical protein